MARVVSYLASLGAQAQLAKLNLVIDQMTGNPDVPDAGPALAEARACHDLALAKIQAVNTAEKTLDALRGERDRALAQARGFYSSLGRFAESRTRGTPTGLLGCGFHLARTERKSQPMPRVENLALFTGDDDGTARAKWKPIRSAKSYEVQVSEHPVTEETWRHYQTVTSASSSLKEQASGHKLWVRVRAVNGLGHGPWSDPACAMVP